MIGTTLKILIIKQTSLGDVLHATAALSAIREAYPSVHLTVLTSTAAQELLTHNPNIDDLIIFDRYGVKRDWWRRPGWTFQQFMQTLRAVRLNEYDLVLDLQGSWKTVIFLWGARARRRLVKGRWWFAERFSQPAVHAITEMAGVLELANIPLGAGKMEVEVAPQVQTAVDRILDALPEPRSKLAVFSPVTRWPTKNWPIANFLSLAERLSDDWFILFTGSVEDRTSLEMSTGTLSPEKGNCLAGQLSLPEFVEIVGRADLVLTGDSLAMHLAVAKARPLIALFGPTDETRVGPLASGQVIRANVACERCYLRHRCHRRCIEKITVQQVLDVIEHGTKEWSAGEAVV